MLHTNHVKRAEIGAPRVKFSEVDGSLISFPLDQNNWVYLKKLQSFVLKMKLITVL